MNEWRWAVQDGRVVRSSVTYGSQINAWIRSGFFGMDVPTSSHDVRAAYRAYQEGARSANQVKEYWNREVRAQDSKLTEGLLEVMEEVMARF